MWSLFSSSTFAWGQVRSKLGGVDTSILHHYFLLIFTLFLSIIPYYHTILMPFLSKYARYTTKRELSGNSNSGPENWEKGRKITRLQMTWNFTRNFYWIYMNLWAKDIPEGATIQPQANRVRPPGHALIVVVPWQASRGPSSPIWCVLPYKKS